jgi:flagellar hook-associated protein 3 FlgL
VERLSTSLVFSLLSRQVAENQKDIVNLSKKINEGKNYVTTYDDPVGIINLVETGGRILENNQFNRVLDYSIQELESAETPLRAMNDLLTKVKEIALRAGNGSTSIDEKIIYKNELRTLGDSLVQLANSKVGDKYIFSGQQSNLQTLRLNAGAPFNSVIYKHNQDNEQERYIQQQQSSVNLKKELVGSSNSASMGNLLINPVTTVSGNLIFSINDGNDNITNFTASISAGDDLSDIISKINTAFTTAGGLGAIAQESPSGYLKFDTSLITGNTPNSKSMILIDKNSSTELTNELYLKKQKVHGTEMGIMHMLASLETALNSNDDSGIRNLLDNIDFNLRQINEKISSVGLLVSQSQMFQSASEDLNIKLQGDLSATQDLDMIEANIKLSDAQNALQTSIRTASTFFNYTLTNFIG